VCSKVGGRQRFSPVHQPSFPQPEPEGKTRITIRLDQNIVDRFFRMTEEAGGATGYQTLINPALREYLDGKAPKFEDTLRRIIREELQSRVA
jgi:uncharacterized protein (DUF4415 family)